MNQTAPSDPRVPQPQLRKKAKGAKRRGQSRVLAVHQPMPPAPAKTLDEQIMRAAADPAVDVNKLRELTTLRRQMLMEEAEEQFNLAMRECQEEMRPIEANANNPQTHSKYATLTQVDSKLRPIYNKHGFALSFNTADSPIPEHTRVLCYVSRGIFTRTYQYDVAVDPKGPKGNDVMTKTHAGGSALSYGKRYLELMIFHIVIRSDKDADDDGNAAAGAHAINAMQKKELAALIRLAGANVEKFCELFQIEAVDDLSSTHFAVAKQQLNIKIKSQQEKKPAGDQKGGML